MIWLYDDRNRKRSERHQQELRLQEHVRLLSSTDAMQRIDNFKQQCAGMFADVAPDKRPSYGAVFRHGKRFTRNGMVITQESLDSVDAARRELQGIWDNIISDFRSGRLPGKITDGSNSRVFKRAQTYMEAAEPLEAANRGRMEDRGHLKIDDQTHNRIIPYLAFTLPGEQFPTFYWGVRPWRFFWLENQQAMQFTQNQPQQGRMWQGFVAFFEACITKMCGGCCPRLRQAQSVELWQERSKTATGVSGKPQDIPERAVLTAAWNNSTAEQEKFLQRISRHWTAVEAAYKKLPEELLPAVSAPAQQQGSSYKPGTAGTSCSNVAAAVPGSGIAASPSSAAAVVSSSAAAADPSSELARLVAKQNELLEQLLGMMQQQQQQRQPQQQQLQQQQQQQLK